ncbi:MAG: hypothetical protein AAF065_13950 [Verrucomicrobiota bacterium]
MEDENTEWVPTNEGTESQIRIGPFTGAAIYIQAAALFGGFFLLYLLVKEQGWPLLSSALISGILPIITAIVLTRLVINKPDNYLLDWVELQVLRLTKTPLLRVIKKKGNDNES